MKKELSLLLQFFLIVLLVGFGLFGFVAVLGRTRLSFWNAYSYPFKNWIVVFLALAAIRLFLIYLNPSIITTNSEKKSFIGKEIWITVQYLIIALVSIMFSFYVPVILNTDKHISLNLVQMWLSFKGTFLYWFVGFLMLSFMRIGIIYIKKVR